ncbi:MAG TPA: plasmid pRiA4b ORF-3 family protein [Planctomycetes bacterium]|nr:plasmid pRiA4b ORF-3 family protein [Planctomycetota bacterium]
MIKKKDDTLICQLKITLKNIEPPIWRRIQVHGDITLFRLHEYIQGFMGWENYHMHEFRIKGQRYGKPDPDGEALFGAKTNKDKGFKVCDLVSDGDVFEYVYDFGDDWRHEIEVEKVMEAEAGAVYPTCLAGERACPEEDCGGPWGYQEMLEILKEPEHEDYEHYFEWLGGEFDLEEFDLDEVNGHFDKVQ